MLPQLFTRRPCRNGRTLPAFRRVVERFERRLAPATASLSTGVLTINYTATGTTPEAVTVANDGTNIVLTGDVTGSLSNPIESVSKIVVNDSGSSSSQSLALAGGTAFSLSGGISSEGVETVNINVAISVTGTSAIAISSQTVTTFGALTTGGGSATLWASNGIALNAAVCTNGGSLNISADTNGDGTGTLIVNADVMTSWTQQSQLVASDGAAGDEFGYSVALSSDGNTAIIGAAGDDVGPNSNQGSVYVFTRIGSVWAQQQQLVASDSASVDRFGQSVALSSDGNTAIIGAPFDDAGAQYLDQGSVYVFTRIGSVWAQQQKLIASDGEPADVFGFSIALSSDGNTAIIGAAPANVDQGSAYVFTRTGNVWAQLQKLIANDGEPVNAFGFSIALSSDGITAVIGARLDDVGANADQGSAYVFVRTGSVWAQQQQLVANDGSGTDQFGHSVALSSDGNTAIIGARLDNVGANTDQGSAYIFTRTGSVWAQQQQLVASDGEPTDRFGSSVALSSDGNTAIIGAWHDHVGANADQGSAYVFTRTGSAWAQQQQLVANDGTVADNFGFSIALSSDGNTAIIGAWHDNLGANTDQGSAYTFTFEAGSGQVTIQCADADIQGNICTSASISISCEQAERAIDLGTNTPGSLGLADTELDLIAAGSQGLFVGNFESGTITVSADATITGNKPLFLTAGGDILLHGNLTNGAGNITLSSSTACTQTMGFIDTAAELIVSHGAGKSVTFNSVGNKAGLLVIPSGMLCVLNGSFDASGAVQVDGTLGGTNGSVGTVTVTGTGKVAPGSSPGKLSTGNIVFNSGSVFSAELNGSNAGNDYNQLIVNGTVDLGGASLSATLGYAPANNQVFTIIENDTAGDAVTGTFNGYIDGASLLIGGYNFTISYKGGDGNDVTLTEIPPPTVPSVVFGDGTPQRSLVKQMVVNFSEAVSFSGPVVNAFTLYRHGTGGTLGNVALSASPATGPASSVTITFSGSLTEFSSLVDGLYDLTIDASQITGAGGNLDGDANSTPGGNYSVIGSIANKYFRLYGDGDGDGIVNQTDFIAFRNAFNGGPSSIFDFEGDGNVTQSDFILFRNRFNLSP